MALRSSNGSPPHRCRPGSTSGWWSRSTPTDRRRRSGATPTRSTSTATSRYDWGPIGQPGDGQYAGTGPASEPETQALISLVNLIQPDLTIWYHQDLYRLSPGEGFEGELKARYAELTGLPIEAITGGTYTGVAATWVRRTIDTPSFIVELGGDLPPEEADLHTAAVLDVPPLVAAQP